MARSRRPGWAHVHALWPTAVQVLADHLDEWLGPDAADSALEAFPTHDDEVDESFRMIFDSWRFYDWIGEDEDSTVASHYLAVAALTPSVNSAVIELIRAANAEPISAFQVKSLRPGRGLFIRDLLRDDLRELGELRPRNVAVPRLAALRVESLGNDEQRPRAMLSATPPPGERSVGTAKVSLLRYLKKYREHLEEWMKSFSIKTVVKSADTIDPVHVEFHFIRKSSLTLTIPKDGQATLGIQLLNKECDDPDCDRLDVDFTITNAQQAGH